MSIPTTSAPNRARGSAVVPSPHPRSKTRMEGLIARELTTASPDSRMNAAISVKSPFSHNALFGFMRSLLYHLARCWKVLFDQKNEEMRFLILVEHHRSNRL